MKTKSGKSCGTDELPYEVLKSNAVIKILHKMFMFYFDTGITPSIWRKAIICPLLKDPSSDPLLPLNYRGISLLSVVTKIYSSILNKRLVTYLDDNDLLVDEQNGFRSERSCIDHVFTLNSVVKNRNSTFVTFIDLKKAFDMVDRELLEYSLIKKNGVDGHFYHAVKSLYQNTESCVRLGSHYTDWFGCTSGVKQGDNLSPTLFALFINDLALQLKDLNNGIEIGGYKLNVLLYADDIALIAQNEAEMDVLLDTVSKWCKKWRLCINPTKSKVVHFRKKQRKQSDHIFKIGENCLEYSPF